MIFCNVLIEDCSKAMVTFIIVVKSQLLLYDGDSTPGWNRVVQQTSLCLVSNPQSQSDTIRAKGAIDDWFTIVSKKITLLSLGNDTWLEVNLISALYGHFIRLMMTHQSPWMKQLVLRPRTYHLYRFSWTPRALCPITMVVPDGQEGRLQPKHNSVPSPRRKRLSKCRCQWNSVS